MGKNNKFNKPSKNVFKVAGSRSFKIKNKAKAVSTQLKKLNEVNKRKVDEVDKQLTLLQKEVRQTSVKNVENSKDTSRLISSDNVKQFEESEQKSAEALEKLSDMSM
ncbi:ribosomal biogenesis factor-like [Lycorma delicatula]|uniref:ribosomal biogenesis factor-like n=1 Tax=Lycorma delicatula TaxID=130591 RepID=UPI003F518345